jgi:hypothetical protein
MTLAYKQALAILDKLTPSELAALMGAISQRLQGVVGGVEEDEQADSNDASRQYLPRLPQMIEWGVIVPMEDKLYVQGHEDQPALFLDAYRVAFNGEPKPINDWAKQITGWKAVNIYEWVIVQREGHTLDQIRRDYMSEHGQNT